MGLQPECDHLEFEANVNVIALAENDEALSQGEINRYVAEVRIRCSECHTMFGFLCSDVGLFDDRPSVSADFLELRAPLVMLDLGPIEVVTIKTDDI